MKLSDIVAYLNLLETLDVHDEASVSVKKLAAIIHVIANHQLQFDTFSQELDQQFQNIQSNLNHFSAKLDQLRQTLTQVVAAREPEYLEASFKLFDQEMRFDSPMHILSRRLPIDPESDTILRSRLKNLTDWRLPGMVIGPGNENFVEDLVALDPLYLVDQHSSLLSPAVQRFGIEYQRRLRQYVVNDHVPNSKLNDLPNNQFGVIFAYNYFNYRPMPVIEQYLKEIAVKLRAGGTFIMTYNNCDRAHGIGLAERSWMCYTPKRLILQAAAASGLEYVLNRDAPGDLSWLEFKRPGEITSLRGGQSLAKIIAKTQ
jgi:SAM-dependent methyltransferase